MDEQGQQLIKSPSQTIHTGIADCKSMSLLVGSLLKNLGITFRYRFTTYDKSKANSKLVSHIYCVAMIESEDVIMDTVYRFLIERKNIYTIKLKLFKKILPNNYHSNLNYLLPCQRKP